MAPKRASKSSAPPPPQPPPPAASSEETDDSRSRSEESEDEETHAVTSTPTTKNAPAPPQKSEESETSDEEEEEEDESDEEPTRAAPASVPKNAPPPPRQSEKSDTSDEEEEEEDESSESDEEAPPAKPAPKQEGEGLKPEAKKPAAPFHRVWSTDDEVRILEALATHLREHGALPQPDALVTALAGSLDNRAYGGKELQGKVKSLKQRYVTAAKKSELPSKEHDRRLFDLSKIVWGGGDKTATPAAAVNAMANGHKARGFGEMCDLYPYLAEEVKELEAAHPGMFKREFGKMDDDKARVLDVKIKKQRLVQMKVELRRGDLVKEVTKTLMVLIE